jgi:hypothetical protein
LDLFPKAALKMENNEAQKDIISMNVKIVIDECIARISKQI